MNILFVFINSQTNDFEQIVAKSKLLAWKELRINHRYERNWKLSGGIS